LEHSWPGNVRELQNCLERSVILCPGTLVEPEHLRISGSGGGRSNGLRDVVDLTGPLADVLKRVTAQAEEEAIALALADSAGDRGAAAARLGISLATLNRRLREKSEGT
jgi:DNA-binding NtrC family response regulator